VARKQGRARVPGSRETQIAWIERVLGAKMAASGGDEPGKAAADLDGDMAHAISAERARAAAPAPNRGVAYRKLLLRWREAQGLVATNLQALGSTLLARPDIQADPRLDQIEEAVGKLLSVVPQFGGALEDVLDSAMSTSDPAELARLSRDGVATIDTYRQQLTGAAQLRALEAFAAKDLGTTLPLVSALDDVLSELEQQLAA
jgi:hypothetical protein